MARDNYDEKERKYANDRLAEIAEHEQEECIKYLVKLDDTVHDRTDQDEGDFEGFFAEFTRRFGNRQK